jgi:hypothetical protein
MKILGAFPNFSPAPHELLTSSPRALYRHQPTAGSKIITCQLGQVASVKGEIRGGGSYVLQTLKLSLP